MFEIYHVIDMAGTAELELVLHAAVFTSSPILGRPRGCCHFHALCSQHFLRLLMALPEGPSPKAFWTDIETWELVKAISKI